MKLIPYFARFCYWSSFARKFLAEIFTPIGHNYQGVPKFSRNMDENRSDLGHACARNRLNFCQPRTPHPAVPVSKSANYCPQLGHGGCTAIRGAVSDYF